MELVDGRERTFTNLVTRSEGMTASWARAGTAAPPSLPDVASGWACCEPDALPMRAHSDEHRGSRDRTGHGRTIGVTSSSARGPSSWIRRASTSSILLGSESSLDDPLCSRPDTRLPRPITESPPTTPVSASHPRRAHVFRRCIVRVLLQPAVCPALRTGYDERGPLGSHPRVLRLRVTRFSRRPSPAAAGSQARGAAGKSPLVGTCHSTSRSR
jgi:hypothetical protein